MYTTLLALIGGTALVVATTAVSLAGPGRRVHHTPRVDSYGYPAYGYDNAYGYDGPGAIVARAAARAQTEPGVTRELAPDAVQTATGGPSGGVPGFSGGF